jgi:hypothetical protein
MQGLLLLREWKSSKIPDFLKWVPKDFYQIYSCLSSDCIMDINDEYQQLFQHLIRGT